MTFGKQGKMSGSVEENKIVLICRIKIETESKN